MTNLKNTLDSALPNGAQFAYPNEYTAVMDALNERDYSLTDQITEVVNREFGTPVSTIRQQLVAAGMEVRPEPQPEPVAVPDMAPFEAALTEEMAKPVKKAKKGKKSEVAKLAKVVNKLVKAARNHGVSI